MGTIYRSARLDVPADAAAEFLERFAAAEVHVFSLSQGERLDGDDRIVAQADGSELVERNVTVDRARRRVVYTVPGLSGVEHHQAEMRIDLDARGAVTLVWTIDFLPHRLADERGELYDRLFAELITAACGYAAARAERLDPAVDRGR